MEVFYIHKIDNKLWIVNWCKPIQNFPKRMPIHREETSLKRCAADFCLEAPIWLMCICLFLKTVFCLIILLLWFCKNLLLSKSLTQFCSKISHKIKKAPLVGAHQRGIGKRNFYYKKTKFYYFQCVHNL